jgi:hypothetical protein
MNIPSNCVQHFLSQSAQQIITAVPAGIDWCLKIINGDGESICLPGRFGSRLEALIAAVLLAEHFGARVVP